MQVNNLAKIVNFIVANIGNNDASNVFNGRYGERMLVEGCKSVDVNENMEVDIEAAKLLAKKYLDRAKIVSLREFEVTSIYENDHSTSTEFYYELQLSCKMNRFDHNNVRIEVPMTHTFYFKLSSNYPNGGYRLEEDFNYAKDEFGAATEWLSNDGMLSRVVGWKYVHGGSYFVHV